MSNRYLLCDLAPYKYSTRTQKIGASLSRRSPDVLAMTLDKVGRVGMSDDAHSFVHKGVAVRQIPVKAIDQRRTLTASIRNVLVYIPAILRLRREVLRTQASTILIGHVSLIWLGAAHRRRWGSKLVISGRERPGGVRTKGSLATWFSRVEPAVLRSVARHHRPTVVAVCDGHAEEFKRLGVQDTVVVRNVPAADFAKEFVPPPPADELIVSCVGSLYPGRGIEALISAVTEARRKGAAIRLDITGPAAPDYRAGLESQISKAEAGDYITLHGPCTADEVAARYQASHVGTALYEAVDAANDSLSNKLFEAVVAGRPVIAGNLPENTRVIETYGVGWTSPVEATELSGLLSRLAADVESIRGLAKRCYDAGQAHFTWDKEVEPLLAKIEN